MAEPVPRLPEEAQVVLKRRKENDSRRIKRAKIDQQRKTKRRDTTRIQFKRAESFVASYRRREHERAVLIRKEKLHINEQAQRGQVTKTATDDAAEPETSVTSLHDGRIILAVRVNGGKAIDPLQRRALETLRLNSRKAAVFLRFNAATAAQLRILSDHVLWGAPSAHMVRELLFKRGQAVESGKLVPLNDNRVVERALGSQNILCVEDLLVELLAEHASPQFETVARFIAPMHIAPPRIIAIAALGRQRKLRVDGDFAARQKLVETVLGKML